MPTGGKAAARKRLSRITNHPSPSAASSGFTLIELMVVLAIVGLAGAAIALSMPPGESSLHRQADTFALHLVRAREEAILGGHAVRVVVDAQGYAFMHRDGGDWRPLQPRAFAPRTWQGDVQPRLGPREPQVDFGFEPTGGADARTLVLELADHRVGISLDAAGKVRIE
jgi:general secretion pathway protein H